MAGLGEYLKRRRRLRQFGRVYLDQMGWFETIRKIPRDWNGPVPWITYPALRQLRRLVRPEFRVFEYGCGSSSRWWATQVAEVVSVEHDRAWADRVRADLPPNLHLILREREAPADPAALAATEPFFADRPDLPTRGDDAHDEAHGLLCTEFRAYAAELVRYGPGYFDVIVIDGMARSLTAWLAARLVKPDGFVLFDNSDRWQYNAGYRALAEAGFHRIDYHGPGPVNTFGWCTSIFTRTLTPFAGQAESPKGDNDLGW